MAKKKRSSSNVPAIAKTDRQYEIKSAADTLIQANQIKADRKLMPGVRVELKKRQQAIKKAIK